MSVYKHRILREREALEDRATHPVGQFEVDARGAHDGPASWAWLAPLGIRTIAERDAEDWPEDDETRGTR